jgi:dipeptidyl aminopeptidase/acylaminoacyl peptidase
MALRSCQRLGWHARVATAGLLMLALGAAAFGNGRSVPPAAELPIEAFARLPAIRNVALSPDGRRVAFIGAHGDQEVAIAFERGTSSANIVVASDPGNFELQWCGWANDERILCSLLGVWPRGPQSPFPVTRLVAASQDGTKQTLLTSNGRAHVSQLQEVLIDWLRHDPSHVLVQRNADQRSAYPSVFRVSVDDGRHRTHTRSREPIRAFATDSRGNVTLGWGARWGSTEQRVFGRLEGGQWRRLTQIHALRETGGALRPIAGQPGSNLAYALGLHEGRYALWRIDLRDQREPELFAAHPLVDVESVQSTFDRRLLGIQYEVERPEIHYFDQRAAAVVEAVRRALATEDFVESVEFREEETVHVIRTLSDVDAGSWYVFDTTTGALEFLGTSYPELDRSSLAPMQAISYRARDGVEIPGYLTMPVSSQAGTLPTVILPHGGYISRDRWRFDYLRLFLANRGYAVLQMNFRGSGGYGAAWRMAAHQDWGGVTYDDIVDGTRWAVERGIADPERICIVGRDFSGYAALLGAARNPDLYRCAASVGGISDLQEVLWLPQIRQQLRQDSPRRHIDAIQIPVLLVHGDRDLYVPEELWRMAAALERAGKQHEFVRLENTTHHLGRKSGRVALLAALERFLAASLSPATHRIE